MEILAKIIVVIELWFLMGVVVMFPFLKRMAEFTNRVRESKYTPFKELVAWPYYLWFYTHKDTIAAIAYAKHSEFPWFYDKDGKEYSEEEQKQRLNEYVRRDIEQKIDNVARH